MSWIVTLIIAVLVFGCFIFVHETGHFVMARVFHVTVNEFSIGMGPKIFSHASKKSGTVYSLRLLPFGGFVSMAGEDEESDDENAFCKKKVWQRLLITVAGCVMNLILGVILVVAMVCSSEALGTNVVHSFKEENSATYSAGLRENDRITVVDGTPVHTSTELVYEVMRKGVEKIDITVVRDGESIVLNDVEFPTVVSDGILFGSVDFYVYSEAKTFSNVVKQSFWQSVSSIKMIWDSLFDLVTGRYGFEHVSGPVGTTEQIGKAASQGGYSFLYICAIISLNLGVFNLLPVPALDGGRVFFLIIEMIRRKPINPKYEGYIHAVGLALLLLLMVVVTYKDIVKLFVG